MRLCDLFCHDFEIYTLALSIRAPVRLQRREPTIVTPCSTRHRFCVLNIELTVYFLIVRATFLRKVIDVCGVRSSAGDATL